MDNDLEEGIVFREMSLASASVSLSTAMSTHNPLYPPILLHSTLQLPSNDSFAD